MKTGILLPRSTPGGNAAGISRAQSWHSTASGLRCAPNPVLVVLAFVLLVLVVLATTPDACAQSINPSEVPPADEFFLPGGSTYSADTPATFPDPQSYEYAGPPADSGFWIVSTHHSAQSFGDGGPRFCPAVTRYDRGSGYRPGEFSELCQHLQPGVPVCVMVHGSFVRWEDVCRESRCTWEWLQTASAGQPMQMIYLTWPSDRPPVSPVVQIDVNLLGRRASRNGFYLADVIRSIPVESPVCLMGHSHGTRVIASALHLMGGGTVQGWAHPTARCSGRRVRTIFAAAAIDHDWLNPGERFGRALCSTECLLNMHNDCDPALNIYPLRCLFTSRALGDRGFSWRDRRAQQGWTHKVRDFDVSPMVGRTHLWPYYFNRRDLAWSIRPYVYFTDVAAPVMHGSIAAAN